MDIDEDGNEPNRNTPMEMFTPRQRTKRWGGKEKKGRVGDETKPPTEREKPRGATPSSYTAEYIGNRTGKTVRKLTAVAPEAQNPFPPKDHTVKTLMPEVVAIAETPMLFDTPVGEEYPLIQKKKRITRKTAKARQRRTNRRSNWRWRGSKDNTRSMD